jgi:hypothetical protein
MSAILFDLPTDDWCHQPCIERTVERTQYWEPWFQQARHHGPCSAIDWAARSQSYSLFPEIVLRASSLHVEGVRLPPQLAEFADAVVRGKSRIPFFDDWDGEGSPAYLEETWRRSVQTVLRTASDVWKHRGGIILPLPALTPGPDQSIDIYWDLEDRTLLVNVPNEPDVLAQWYGKSDKGLETKGTTVLDVSLAGLVSWFLLS